MKKKKLERILAAHYRRIEALEEWRLAELSGFNNRASLAKRLRFLDTDVGQVYATVEKLEGRLESLETGETQLHALIEGFEKRLDGQRSELLEWLRR